MVSKAKRGRCHVMGAFPHHRDAVTVTDAMVAHVFAWCTGLHKLVDPPKFRYSNLMPHNTGTLKLGFLVN